MTDSIVSDMSTGAAFVIFRANAYRMAPALQLSLPVTHRSSDLKLPGGTMELDTLKDLYVEGLKDLYSAEKQILKALPKMMKAATDPELKRGFMMHERQTKQHVQRLERICKELGKSPTGKKRIENIVESTAIEVERISEGQRFTTKLLSERGGVAGQR
jgi:hypothetical protein